MTDPRTEGGTLTSFTSYFITSTLNPEGVRRRFSDFDWLRDILVARFHGIAVPLMPEKRMVGNNNKGFIEERMQGLENFLSLVLANPYMRADTTLRMFMTVGAVVSEGGGDWCALRAETCVCCRQELVCAVLHAEVSCAAGARWPRMMRTR